MDLALTRTVETVTADRPWLASQHGTDTPVSITLDLTLFTDPAHYAVGVPGGQVPAVLASGVPVAPVTASGLYGPWDAAAEDGRAVLAGLLLSETAVAAGSTRAGAALLWHGLVAAAHVPGGLDPATVAQSRAQLYFL